MQTEILRNLMDRKKEVNYGSLILSFAIPNSLNRYRADTFVTKEPETLEWIDSIPNGSIFWDIGANVGLYSCYAAKKRNCRVFSFEPSVFNLELLARNIYLNDLGDRVTIIPLPLSEKLSFSKLNMTTKEWGGALSTYDQNYGHDGKPMRTVFNFPTIGLSMDESANLLKIPQPAYIKMDVDGIEHLILKGGKKVLSKVKGILIEINDSFDEQAKESRKYLEKAGFQLKEKRHAEEFNTGMAQFTFNQIWIRKMKTKA
ncbi:FkbM family methyltransferase [Leptospira stimsonii]|uniref:FkbM family methyltransferase n=2 Tax=Leptospira stimsonii TaxID=2202203 RepID=A0A4R9KZ51_9LEPT|nr:FkbM family methyltransferase [Leptospira stimsonii]TGK14646.1 FkbM family methyltransferase [Leptospira stimsonii]TGM10048.1 FkbM family methyltransferase [Leptospira stimsonii]